MRLVVVSVPAPSRVTAKLTSFLIAQAVVVILGLHHGGKEVVPGPGPPVAAQRPEVGVELQRGLVGRGQDLVGEDGW